MKTKFSRSAMVCDL